MSLAEQRFPANWHFSQPSSSGEIHRLPEKAVLAESESAFLARLLIESASLSRSALDGAMHTALESGERLETVLTHLGFMTEKELAEVLARALDLPLVRAEDFPDAPLLDDTLSSAFLKKSCLIPLKDEGDALTVAMIYPLDAYAVAAMRFAYGKNVRRVVAYPADFATAFKRLYGETVSEANGIAHGRTNTAGILGTDIAGHADGASDAPLFVIGRWFRGLVRVYVATASKFSAAQTALRQAPQPVRRAISLGLVAAVHLLGLWLIADAVLPVVRAPAQEIGMAVSSLPASTPRETLPPPDFASPATVEVPVPAIEIANEDAPNAIVSAVGDTSVIAPRPDPAHPNDAPDGSGAGHAAQVVLRILVLEDGSVGDDSVAQSSGTADLDALALAYAKANWRYLPATLAGRAIQAWTTVIVRFR